jgi:hypothetical protein
MLGKIGCVKTPSAEILAPVFQNNILRPCLPKREIDVKPFTRPSIYHTGISLFRSDRLKIDFPESPLPFHRGVSFGDIGKCSGSANLGAKRQAITEVAGHGPFGSGVKHWSAIRTGIQTGLAPNALFLICDDRARFREPLPGARRAGRHARRLLTVLTDDWHEDRYLFPLLHMYPRKGRTAGALMGEAANHLTGLASCAPFRDDRNRAHLNFLQVRSL